ncbi:hypothetical protein TYRP_001997 [Tyrophagus putrescentiae]|nr:hypothetical protein TYRP_001997 [Tyrophagus putrescentiae]
MADGGGGGQQTNGRALIWRTGHYGNEWHTVEDKMHFDRFEAHSSAIHHSPVNCAVSVQEG